MRLLERAGYSVWWDQGIEPGDDWFNRILDELERSSLTLGIWSQASIDARGAFTPNGQGKYYVKNEHDKTERGRLIPVVLDEGRIALEFSHIQAVSLVGWGGEESDACARLTERVAALLGEAGRNAPEVPPPASKPHRAAGRVRLDFAAGMAQPLFALAREIPTARYMGPTFSKNPLIRLLSVTSRMEGSYHIRNFDWDGGFRVVRPCDVHIGIDEWDLSSGDHKWNATISDESLATMFALRVHGGVLFGNGGQRFLKPDFGDPKNVSGALNPHSIHFGFGVSIDRKLVAACEETRGDNQTASLVLLSFSQSVSAERILIAQGRNETGLGYSVLLDPDDSDGVFCLQRVADLLERPPQRLVRVSRKEARATHAVELAGLRNISKHRTRQELAAMTTAELVRIDAKTLQIVHALPLTRPRERELYFSYPIQHSLCGRRLAFAYDVTGEIEIRQPDTLDPLLNLETQGIPASIFEWSADGNFLAAAVRPRSNVTPSLIVWDVANERVAGVFPNIALQANERLYSSAPKTFYWHPSYNEFVMLTTNGRIQHYRLR